MHAELKLKNIEGDIKLIGTDLHVKPQEVAEGKFLVTIDKDKLTKLNTPIEILVTSDGKTIEVIKTSFLGKVDRKD